METIKQQFKIDSIHYDNTTTKVLIKGETINNHLSYRSEMFVNFSHLNHILCEVLKRNEEIQLDNVTEQEEFGSYLSTTITLSYLRNTTIELDNFHQKHQFVQIRA